MNEEAARLLLLIIAAVLAGIDIYRSKGQTLVGWAVLLVIAVLLIW